MDKKLILIGNKPISKDMSFIDSEFDYILRVNKMCNLGTTGNRIDGVYLGLYSDFTLVHKGGKHKDLYKTAKDIYMLPLLWNFFFEYKEYMSTEQYKAIKFFDFDAARTSIGACATSTVCILWNLLNNKEITDNYEIYLTGIDIEGRDELLKNGNEWKDSLHANAGEAEERFIKDCINKGLVKYVNCE